MIRPRCRIAFVIAFSTAGTVATGGAVAGGERPAVATAGPAYEIVSTVAKRVRGELTLDVLAPEVEASEWLVYASRLPELPGQIDVRSKLSPGGTPGRELSSEGRPILFARVVPKGSLRRKDLKVRVEYEATLVARKLVKTKPGEVPDPVPPLDAKTRRLALAEGPDFDFRSRAFQSWLDKHELRRGVNEGDVDLARRVFLTIKHELRYLYTDNMDRVASHVCQARKSDCGGMSIVFVSALRANQVPARVLTGRWALSSEIDPKTGNPFDQQHAKAEFFADGVGWVPVDAASGVVHDRSPEGLRFFGDDPGDFVTFHVDNGLVFDTYFGRQNVEWLQSPAFWVTGGGSVDGQTSQLSWKVEARPVEFQEAVFRKPVERSASPAPSKIKSPTRRRGSRP